MGLVKTRRLAAMHKQECAKAGLRPPCFAIGSIYYWPVRCQEIG